MSRNSDKPSKLSNKLEKELLDSEMLEVQLQAELTKLRKEMKALSKEKPNKEIQAQATKLESKIGTLLLDLAEEIPLAGKAVKWFRSWMNG